MGVHFPMSVPDRRVGARMVSGKGAQLADKEADAPKPSVRAAGAHDHLLAIIPMSSCDES